MPTTAKKTTKRGSALWLPNGLKVEQGTPEFESLQRLDSQAILTEWGEPVQFQLFRLQLAEFGFSQPMTFGELRRVAAKLTREQCGKLRAPIAERIRIRLSAAILCGCGQPLILHRDHVACESFFCVAFQPMNAVDLKKLRTAFPGQISQTKGE